jgi:ubiquinone/menaquinone biosynthesis C-methylase UbiE
MSDETKNNVDPRVTTGFGHEWSTFRQNETQLTRVQRDSIFHDYFDIFPWHALPADGGVGIDVGCGSGRWAVQVATRVAHLHLLDASVEALAVAKQNLASTTNATFHLASVANIPIPADTLDFAYSLGVLHHVPNTEAAIAAIARILKPGAPFLVYLYYALENRPAWYRGVWRVSNAVRVVMSQLPHPIRLVLSQIIAAFVYWPLVQIAKLVDKLGGHSRSLPLSYYRDKTFYVMRTDAYDRFCTSLEKRFTRPEIQTMLSRSGFERIQFSDHEPFWCAVAYKSGVERRPPNS